MDPRAHITKLTVSVLFLVMNPKIECVVTRPPPPPIQPTRLCTTQISVASRGCSMLPFSAVPPPSPPLPPSEEDPSPPSQDNPSPSPDSPPSPPRRHRHRHRQQEHIQTPAEQECCHWLQAIDNECVCDMLVRLPVFLSRPAHKYTVITDPSCNVTYTCPGRLMSL